MSKVFEFWILDGFKTRLTFSLDGLQMNLPLPFLKLPPPLISNTFILESNGLAVGQLEDKSNGFRFESTWAHKM